MTAIETAIDINRPAADVFDYAINPALFAQWQNGVVEGGMMTPGAPEVGSLCTTTRRIGFSNRASTSVVTHVDPPASWGVRGTDGPIRAAVDLTVEAISAGSSRLTISVDFQGHGIGALLVPLVVRRQARWEMPANVSMLKQRLEGSGGPAMR
jgi:hypothetical protein